MPVVNFAFIPNKRMRNIFQQLFAGGSLLLTADDGDARMPLSHANSSRQKMHQKCSPRLTGKLVNGEVRVLRRFLCTTFVG